MKRHVLFLIITFACATLNAQEIHRFRTIHLQGFSIENSTKSGLSLHYAVREIGIAEIENGKALGQEIMLKGCFGSVAEGLPNLPFENRYIAIPNGAKVSIKVKENGCKTLNDIDLLPVAEVQQVKDSGSPQLHKNMAVFGTDAPFPSENVAIVQTTQIRGLDVVLLSVTPFRYNPVQKTLEVIYDMDIDIRFEGGNGQFGEARYRNPAWDNILRDLVINSDMLPEAHYYERLIEAIQNKTTGCEYLIITPDDSVFMAWADTLKQFRTRQGILTKVVTTTDCGGNEPENIRNYIFDAYQNWAIPPASVLLFGGNRKTAPDFGLKPYIFSIPSGQTTIYDYPCDNAFADMNGDSIPDLAISRFPATTSADCETYVKKCIQYEQNPPTDPFYYDRPLISSGYEEDKWFFINTQSVNGFYRNKLGKHPTNLYMVYDQWNQFPATPDSIWSSANNTAAVLDYFGPNGTQYIPKSISGFDEWKRMTEKELLKSAINEGTFLTLYCDHSSQDGYCCPFFDNSDIASLTNQHPTFTINISCLTNNFWDNWCYCFTEVFNKATVGALGGIGAVSVTYTHYNDILNWGMFDYIWPDFMPTFGSQTAPQFVFPSYALVAGKIFLGQQTFLPYNLAPNKIEKTMNLFNYLGETYLNLYTEVPRPLAMEAPLYHADNLWQYTFSAEEGALICFSRNNEILYVTQATGHPQSFTLPQMEVGDQFTITATKQNRFRTIRNVTVVASEQPFVWLAKAHCNDQNGNGQLDYGEHATFDLTVHNIGQMASGSGEITLLCESPYVNVEQGTALYTELQPNSSRTLENAFRIKVSNDIPDQTEIPFLIRFTEGGNSHDETLNLTANAPLIRIKPEFHIMTANGNPSTHIDTTGHSYITFTITNIGHSTAEYLNAKLSVKAPFVEVETEPIQHHGLAWNEALSLTYELASTPNSISGAWPQIHLDIQYDNRHTCLDTIVQYGGIFENFETDTLNPFFQWTNSGNTPWVYCEEDVFEGQRCFIATSNSMHNSIIIAKLKKPYLNHDSKISFHYQTDENEPLWYYTSINNSVPFLSASWQYAEVLYNGEDLKMYWQYRQSDPNYRQAKLDNICFPPMHRTIAFAGNDLVSCREATIHLREAYAYDCNSLLWTTSGDGHFDCDTLVNPIYFPGNQDITNENLTLTISALGSDTVISSMQIHLVDEINLGGIVGDSIVNKYENPISHYFIENQVGLRYLWQLEPVEAGFIYENGNQIDILWNLREGDVEANLTVTVDNGCENTPISKRISLIGTGILEWHSPSFELFPNPTDGKLNLVFGENIHGKAVIEVYNILGERKLFHQTGHLRHGETLSLDLSGMASGLYIIKLSTDNGCCSKKVSVK